MTLLEFLQREQQFLLDRWFGVVTDTYAPETSRLLKKETNQFANPVGHTLLSGMKDLLEVFLKGAEVEEVAPFLDRIVRIRAIQEFTPSQALGFLFLLKDVVAERVKTMEEGFALDELLAFNRKVDELGLLGFDIYSKCREQLFEVRVGEIKNRTYRLLQRAGLLSEAGWGESKPGEGDTIG